MPGLQWKHHSRHAVLAWCASQQICDNHVNLTTTSCERIVLEVQYYSCMHMLQPRMRGVAHNHCELRSHTDTLLIQLCNCACEPALNSLHSNAATLPGHQHASAGRYMQMHFHAHSALTKKQMQDSRAAPVAACCMGITTERPAVKVHYCQGWRLVILLKLEMRLRELSDAGSVPRP